MGRIVTALITEAGGGDTIISCFLRAMETKEKASLEQLTQNPLFNQRVSQYVEVCRQFPSTVETDRTARESDWIAMNNYFRALLKKSKISPNTPIVNADGKPLQQNWLYVIYSKNYGGDRREKGENTIGVWLERCLQDIENVVDRLLSEQNIRFGSRCEEEVIASGPSEAISRLSKSSEISIENRTSQLISKMRQINDVILLEKSISHCAEGSTRSLEGTLVGQICKKYDALSRKKTESTGITLSEIEATPPLTIFSNSQAPAPARIPLSSSSSPAPSTPIVSPLTLSFQAPASTQTNAAISAPSPRTGPNPATLKSEQLMLLERECTDKLISLYGAINGAVNARWVLVRLLCLTLDIAMPALPPITATQQLGLDGLSEEQFRSQFNDIVKSWVGEEAMESTELPTSSDHYEEIKLGLQSYLHAIKNLNQLGQEISEIRLKISFLDQSHSKSFGHEPSPRSATLNSRTPRTVSRDRSSMLRGFGSLFNLITKCLNDAAGASFSIVPKTRSVDFDMKSQEVTSE